MTISSTEFQQNVGKYLAMAEKGIPVIVERKKPKHSRFRLTREKKPIEKQDRRARKKEYMEWLDSLGKFGTTYPDKDSVAYQRRIRS